MAFAVSCAALGAFGIYSWLGPGSAAAYCRDGLSFARAYRESIPDVGDNRRILEEWAEMHGGSVYGWKTQQDCEQFRLKRVEARDKENPERHYARRAYSCAARAKTVNQFDACTKLVIYDPPISNTDPMWKALEGARTLTDKNSIEAAKMAAATACGFPPKEFAEQMTYIANNLAELAAMAERTEPFDWYQISPVWNSNLTLWLNSCHSEPDPMNIAIAEARLIAGSSTQAFSPRTHAK